MLSPSRPPSSQHPIQRSLNRLIHCCFIESLSGMVHVLLTTPVLFLLSVTTYHDHWQRLTTKIHQRSRVGLNLMKGLPFVCHQSRRNPVQSNPFLCFGCFGCFGQGNLVDKKKALGCSVRAFAGVSDNHPTASWTCSFAEQQLGCQGVLIASMS